MCLCLFFWHWLRFYYLKVNWHAFRGSNFPISFFSFLLNDHQLYSTAQETRKFVTLKLIKYKICWIQDIYILHVKLTVYYTLSVSFTCNIYFLHSTYFIFNQFESNMFSCFFRCYIYNKRIFSSRSKFFSLRVDHNFERAIVSRFKATEQTRFLNLIFLRGITS